MSAEQVKSFRKFQRKVWVLLNSVKKSKMPTDVKWFWINYARLSSMVALADYDSSIEFVEDIGANDGRKRKKKGSVRK